MWKKEWLPVPSLHMEGQGQWEVHYLKIQEGCVPAIVRHYKYFSYFYNWVHLKYYLLPKMLHSKCIVQNNYHLFWSHQNITQKTIRVLFFFFWLWCCKTTSPRDQEKKKRCCRTYNSSCLWIKWLLWNNPKTFSREIKQCTFLPENSSCLTAPHLSPMLKSQTVSWIMIFVHPHKTGLIMQYV